MKADILFVLSCIEDIPKLKLSLRTIESHARSYGDIHVVGIDVSKHFCSAEDSRICNHIIKDINSSSAYYDPKPIVRTCQLIKYLSEWFLLMNLKGFVCDDINVLYHANEFVLSIEGEGKEVSNTMNIINVHGLKDLNFDAGHPVFVQKEAFVETMNKFHYELFPSGLMFRSLYLNSYGGVRIRDVFGPVDNIPTSTILLDEIKQRKTLTFKDGAYTGFVEQELFKIYNTPSKWEL